MQRPFSLEPWLSILENAAPSNKYYHTVLVEDGSQRADHISRLSEYIHAAHEDARRHLDALAGDSLDPFEDAPRQIYPEYPRLLDRLTLQGYFGEVLAAIFAENYDPHEISGWCVPVFMFCLHDAAFDQLETHRQTGRPPRRIPGQSGDDCLAFIRDATGNVTKCLVCESKCSTDHNADLVRDAHANISRPEEKPVSIRKVLQILKERNDPLSQDWLMSLQRFWLGDAVKDYERLDLVMYVCMRPAANQKCHLASDGRSSFCVHRTTETPCRRGPL